MKDWHDLVRYTDKLSAKYKQTAWHNSPFAWIKMAPSKSIGVLGEDIVSAIMRGMQNEVRVVKDSRFDRVINGVPVEIKTSTLWQSGKFVFQQLRNQPYKEVYFLAIAPFEMRLWRHPKETVQSKWKPQHTGKEGTETFWITIDADDVPSWFDVGLIFQEFQNNQKRPTLWKN